MREGKNIIIFCFISFLHASDSEITHFLDLNFNHFLELDIKVVNLRLQYGDGLEPISEEDALVFITSYNELYDLCVKFNRYSDQKITVQGDYAKKFHIFEDASQYLFLNMEKFNISSFNDVITTPQIRGTIYNYFEKTRERFKRFGY